MTFSVPATEVFLSPMEWSSLAPRHAAWIDCPPVVKDGKVQVRFEYFRPNVPKQEKLT